MTESEIKDLLVEPTPAEQTEAIAQIRSNHGKLKSRSPQEQARLARLLDGLSNSLLNQRWHDSADGSMSEGWEQDIEDWIATEWPEYRDTVAADIAAFKLAEVYCAGGNREKMLEWLKTMAKQLDQLDFSCTDGVVMLKRLGITLSQALA